MGQSARFELKYLIEEPRAVAVADFVSSCPRHFANTVCNYSACIYAPQLQWGVRVLPEQEQDLML